MIQATIVAKQWVKSVDFPCSVEHNIVSKTLAWSLLGELPDSSITPRVFSWKVEKDFKVAHSSTV